MPFAAHYVTVDFVLAYTHVRSHLTALICTVHHTLISDVVTLFPGTCCYTPAYTPTTRVVDFLPRTACLPLLRYDVYALFVWCGSRVYTYVRSVTLTCSSSRSLRFRSIVDVHVCSLFSRLFPVCPTGSSYRLISRCLVDCVYSIYAFTFVPTVRCYVPRTIPLRSVLPHHTVTHYTRCYVLLPTPALHATLITFAYLVTF